MNIPTPHISASEGEIAKTVLMPGDPLRAKFIAENFLTDAKCYNFLRGMLGYTGIYKGKEISVQGSGMGMPSMGIYSYELFNFYGVENIIRIGTAGAICDNVHIRDVIIALGACTDSNYGRQYNLPGHFAPIASFELLERAVSAAKKQNIAIKVGNVFSSDCFYGDGSTTTLWNKMGVMAVEMEAAALYMNAARAGKNALCILTISDEILTGKFISAEERQTTFTQMMEIALEIA